MSELVKVSSKGILTLPKFIRQKLNIDVGDNLDVSIETGKVILQKADIMPKKIGLSLSPFVKDLPKLRQEYRETRRQANHDGMDSEILHKGKPI